MDITTNDAAKMLGVSYRHVVKLLHGGKLQGQKAGGRWVVDHSSVEKRIAANPQRGLPPRADGRRYRSIRIPLTDEEFERVRFLEPAERRRRLLNDDDKAGC